MCQATLNEERTKRHCERTKEREHHVEGGDITIKDILHTKGNLGNKDSLKDKRLGGERSNEPKALKTSTSERLGQRGREAQKKSEKGEKDIVGSNFGRKDEGKHRGTATKNKVLGSKLGQLLKPK